VAGTVVQTTIRHRSRGVVRQSATLVTDAAGVATAAATGVAFGKLVGVFYDGGLDASAVVTVRDSKTGAALFTLTTGTEGTPVTLRPTAVITDVAGAAITAADTAPNVNRDIYIAGRVTVGVTSGGNVETGKIALIVDEAELGKPITNAA
jgi:hypothetical protein